MSIQEIIKAFARTHKYVTRMSSRNTLKMAFNLTPQGVYYITIVTNKGTFQMKVEDDAGNIIQESRGFTYTYPEFRKRLRLLIEAASSWECGANCLY